jgi:hypothetical protein
MIKAHLQELLASASTSPVGLQDAGCQSADPHGSPWFHCHFPHQAMEH